MSSFNLSMEVFGEDSEQEQQKGVEAIFTNMVGDFESGSALESMIIGIEKAPKEHFNPLTVSLINYSVSNVNDKASIGIESHPINMGGSFALSEIQNGVQTMKSDQARLFENIKKSLTVLFGQIIVKREELQIEIDKAQKRLDAFCEMVNMKESINPEAFDPMSKKSFHNLFYSGQIKAKASSVMPDVSHFLTEHTHLYKRLIHAQSNWVLDHKDNVLNSVSGIDSYTVGPHQYLCHGSHATQKPYQKSSILVNMHRSIELPGMKALYMESMDVSNTGLYGDKALNAQLLVESEIDWFDPALGEQMQAKLVLERQGQEQASFQALTKDELLARLSETQRALNDLQHWSDMAFVKMWKDSCFEMHCLPYVIAPTAMKISERALGFVGMVSLKLLKDASSLAGAYAIETIGSMLDFVEFHLER